MMPRRLMVILCLALLVGGCDNKTANDHYVEAQQQAERGK